MRLLPTFVLAVLAMPRLLAAQSAADSAAIRATALDYIDGWYAGDAVRVLDVYGNAASVRVQAATWVDYMHMAKSNGRWVIVNVLWEFDPPAG